MADLTVKDTEPDPTATAQFLDADGNPTSPDDTPQWASSDTSVANVTANPDGLSAAVVKTGKTGATLITCTSTRSSDGTQVVLSATLTVAPSEETSGELTLSAGSAPGTVQPAGTTAPDTSGGVTVSGPGGTTTTDPNAPAPTDPNAPAQPVDPNAPAPTTGDTSAATPNP